MIIFENTDFYREVTADNPRRKEAIRGGKCQR
jgi:hypothetical protein